MSALSWLARLFARRGAAPVLDMVQQKRRLERIAIDAGCSRAAAVKIASLYFRNDLEREQ